MFSWSEEYSVSIQGIDEQHKRLVGMIGTLHNAMIQGKGKQALNDILRDLIEYTKTHFAYEEKLMKESEFQGYEAHKAKHDAMRNKVADVYREFQDGKATITFEVMEFLENWLVKHIMGTDMQYAPCLISKGIS